MERKGFVNIFSRTKTIVSPVAVGWSSEMSEWRSFVISGVNPRRGSVYACLVFCPTQTLLEMRPWKFIITLLPEYQHHPSSLSPSAAAGTQSADLCHVFMLATCLPPPTMNETYMWPQAISADKVPAECTFTLEKTITFLSVVLSMFRFPHLHVMRDLMLAWCRHITQLLQGINEQHLSDENSIKLLY